MNEKTYERVIEYLKQQIQEGKLSCGSKIPSERELAASLNLGRNSVRRRFAQWNIPECWRADRAKEIFW